jgi:hypothetical protein
VEGGQNMLEEWDWFLTISIVVLNLIWWKMPKRLTKAEMFFIACWGAIFQQTVDVYLDLKLDLYGYFTKGVDWCYIPVLLGIFPALGCILLNYFPYGKPYPYKVLYVTVWALGSTLYESISIHHPFFYYNGWRLEWSLFMYPFLFGTNAYIFHIFRKWNRSP